MDQTNHFFNIGYGWLCKHCAAEDADRQRQIHTTPRSASAKDSGLPLASWIDATHQGLSCHRCGIEEMIAGGVYDPSRNQIH